MSNTLINKGTGAFTAAGTWGVVDTTSLNDSEVTAAPLTAAYLESTAFTPGAITVEGVAVKIVSRGPGSPSNTITVRLAQAGSDVVGTVTTMNVSDIDAAVAANLEGGWYFFRFNVAGTPTNVVLLAATAYTLSVKLSATTTAVSLAVPVGTNWSRMLRTSTTAAPGAGDVIHVMGDNISAGVNNAYVVTMDNTATTSFGSLTPPAALSVNKRGTLSFGVASSTAYYLKVKGMVAIYSGGTMNIGTSGSNMPASSSAVLEFDCTASVDSGLSVRQGGTFNAYGAVKKATQVKIANGSDVGGYVRSDSGLAQTVSLIQGSFGAFGNGDTITFTSTTTAGSTFIRTVSGSVNSGSGVSVTSASNAAACVITHTAHGLITGNWIQISGFTGAWVQMNSWLLVTRLTADTFSVPINSAGFGSVTGTPVYSFSILSLTASLNPANTAYGFIPKTSPTTITVAALDNSAPDLSDWASGDTIAIAPTGQIQEVEIPTLNGAPNNSTKVVSLNAALIYPHVSMSELADTRIACEVINLTRNVKIRGISTSLQGYISTGAGAVGSSLTLHYAEIYQMGSAATALKRGIDIQCGTGTVADIQFCAIHDFTGATPVATNLLLLPTTGITISNNCYYRIGDSGTTSQAIVVGIITSVGYTISNNIVMGGCGGISQSAQQTNFNGTWTVTNNRVAGVVTGNSPLALASILGCTVDNNVIHSCGVNGGIFGGMEYGSITNSASWRNLTAIAFPDPGQVIISGLLEFGNALAGMTLAGFCGNEFYNAVIAGDPVLAPATSGVNFSSVGHITFVNCQFGVASGLLTRHGNADITPGGSGRSCQLSLIDCKLASQSILNSLATQQAMGIYWSWIRIQDYNQVSGDNRLLNGAGTLQTDTVIFNSASPSMRMTPLSANLKLESGLIGNSWKVAVRSGATVTVSVATRKSVSTDTGGANYNGNQQRLIVRRNYPVLNTSADTILATASAAVGVWETLTGTTGAALEDGVMEFFLDCDGTVGWVNCDDFTATPAVDTKGLGYWMDGLPVVAGDNIAGSILINSGMGGGLR